MESKSKGYVTENALIIHGSQFFFSFRKVIDFFDSKEIHGIVFDLPGNEFFDKLEVYEERRNGILERLLDANGSIKEKDLF